jgi:ElaB/YqjD/DUF883 family membrane-anchored ribosome-binding protein
MMNASTDKGAWADPGAATRSPADLEREGEQIRADLDRTLDEIERKLSPGELLDRSVDFLRDNGSEFIREAGETVRNNPIPVLLTAAGLIWLTTSIATRHRSRPSEYYEGEEFSSYRGGSEGFGEYGHNDGGIRSKVDEARERVSSAAHRVTDRVAGTAQDVADRARGRLSSTMHSMRDRTEGVRSDFMDLVQRQPIALGALALAAGALIGAALPITRYENRLVGPARDRTLTRAKELGQREYENLKEAVSSTMERREGTGRASSSSGTADVSNPGT